VAKKILIVKVIFSNGAVLTIDIDVMFDNKVNDVIATSKDVPGLVLKAESFNDLSKEIE